MIIAVLGALIVALGVIGLIQPNRFRSLFTSMDSRARFVFAIVTRLVLGGLFWWLADDLRHPQVMRVLAVIAIAAAVGLLLMGRARLDRLIDWWLSRSDGVLRVSALFAAAFGAFLVYAGT